MTGKDIFLAVGVALVLVVAFYVAGDFAYQSEQFEATVVSIEYEGRGGIWGSTSKIVRLDNGSVYELWGLPQGLKEGHTYILEYREPYILRDGYLAIIGELYRVCTIVIDLKGEAKWN